MAVAIDFGVTVRAIYIADRHLHRNRMFIRVSRPLRGTVGYLLEQFLILILFSAWVWGRAGGRDTEGVRGQPQGPGEGQGAL